MTCPCGSDLAFERCCGPLLAGAPAPTAQALMRSRYTAHVRGNIEHIIATHHPDTRDTVDRAGIEAWARRSTWQGLTILNAQAGGAGDDEGTVEFVARYHAEGRDHAHRELSRFRKIDGRWYFVDGQSPAIAPVRAAPRPERNAPCPCGSGKKFKRCHGA